MDENSIKEVWLLTCDYNCTRCEERIFADMGDDEIAKVSEEIASTVDAFGYVVSNYVANVIREELAKGDTEIHIDAEDISGSEYILFKIGIDSGYNCVGDKKHRVNKKKVKPVHKGDTIYATSGYYGEVDCLFSYEINDCREMVVE